MKGYIKRLVSDTKWNKMKLTALQDFIHSDKYHDCDGMQGELLLKQEKIMSELVAVLEQRLNHEKQIHPDYFEDLPKDGWYQQELPFDEDDDGTNFVDGE